MRCVVPTAAVAAFSTLTLVGVAALGFSSGSLDNEVPRGSEWAVASPSSVQVLSPLGGAAGGTPAGTSTGSDDAAVDPGAGLRSTIDPASQRVPSHRTVRTTSRSATTGTGGAAVTAAPPVARPSAKHRTGDPAGSAQSNLLEITLPAQVLTTARETVAAGLRRGLDRELDHQAATNLEERLSSSSAVDDAVAQATGEAAQQGILAAQSKAGPDAPPSVVRDAATTTFREVLPKQLTVAVQPVVLVALGSMRSEVSAGALISALGTAADAAAATVSAEVAPQVRDQVVDLVRTTDGEGVPAPTATVSTGTETAVPADTSSSTTSSTPSATDSATDDPGDRVTEPGPSTTTQPTSDPTSQPTDPQTDRSVEPSETATDPQTDRSAEPSATATDPQTDRSVEPSATATGSPTDTKGDPTAPTSVTTSATSSLTVTVTTSATGAADRQIRISRTSDGTAR